MLTSLVLAVAAMVPPPAPPAPLSPANLPPPPGVMPPPAPPDPPADRDTRDISFAVKVLAVPGPAADVPAKAVAAIAALPGFRFAEVGPDGTARGYTDTCRVAVVVVPDTPSVSAYVVAAGYKTAGDAGVADRPAGAVRDHLAKPPADAKPAARAGSADPPAGRVPALAVHLGLRPHATHRRHLGPLIEFALARRGYPEARSTAVADEAVMSLGTRAGRPPVVLIAEFARCPSTTRFLALSAGPDEAGAAAEARAAGELLVRLLYD